ncbi:hypothetical protein ACIP5Y_07565 [Nocardia sp. NPDC088792]|uniref:hypothetical protein n=1 Tax=Nocardia sp. NPDC088792 TaxID=3364332 RepID=UPI00380DABA8
MSAGGSFGDIARRYCDYTGESLQYVKSCLDIDRATPIPAAPDDQARLEAMILRQLTNRGMRFAHFLGISRIRLQPDNTLIIYLDAVGDLPISGAYSVVEALMPAALPNIQVDGVIGLRVASIGGADLVLRLLGTGAKVILRASQNDVAWNAKLRRRKEILDSDADQIAVWDEPALTSHELEHLDHYGLHPTERDDMAWLGSALLRRINIVQTVSTAYSLRLWTNMRHQWVIDTDTRRDVLLNHTRLMEALTDPVWGIPLEVHKSDCDCRVDSLFNTCCMFTLTHPHDRPGAIQMRCHYERHSDTRDREALERVGADPAWLDRVLPNPPGTAGLDNPEHQRRQREWLQASIPIRN